MSKIQHIENLIYPLFTDKVFNLLRNRHIKCFTYHDINKNPSEFSLNHNLNVNPQNFEKQLIYIKENYNILNPEKLMNGSIDEDSALITFDDGFWSVNEYAKDILHKHKLDSIVFMNMEVAQTGIQWAGMLSYMIKYNRGWMIKNNLENILFLNPKNKLKIYDYFQSDLEDYKRAIKYCGKFLNLDDLSDMENSNIYFGNHLFNHFSCVEINNNQLEIEYQKNHNYLKNMKNYLPFFAYPYGQPLIAYNSVTNHHLRKLNARRIFLGIAYPNSNNNDMVYRISMTNSIDRISKFRAHCIVPEFINKVLKFNIINESI